MMTAFMKLIDKVFPPEEDPTLTTEQRDLKARERKHFIFAFVLILGAMLMLPFSGAVYVILVELKILPSPF